MIIFKCLKEKINKMSNRPLSIPGYVPKDNVSAVNTAEKTAYREDPKNPYQRFEFTGKASEYFGIWIVCVLLTAITLGIYSPWAKVRRNRYFYGNTKFANHTFDYHATGGQIFLGRLVVMLGVIIYSVIARLAAPIAFLLLFILLFLSPYLIKRGIRFNARMTSYRNVRFDFTGNYGGAFVAFIIGPVIAALSLSLLLPVTSRWLWRYLADNLKYGAKPFHSDIHLKYLYGAWFKCLLIFMGGLIIGTLFIYLLLHPVASIMHFALMISYIMFFIVLFAYRVYARNIIISSLIFDKAHPVKSDISAPRYMWILVSNIFVTVLTLGLMRPWAAVRASKYTTERIALQFNGDWQNFYHEVDEQVSAVGAEYIDLEGIDLAF